MGFAIGIGACFKQRVDHIEVAFGRRPHQRGLLLKRFHCVDVGPPLEQQADTADVSGARGGHKWRLSVRMGKRRIRSSLEQGFHNRRIAGTARLK